MDSIFKRVLSPPLSLLTLVALTPAEHEVWIEDENIQRLNVFDAPDLVGITVNVDTSERAFEISRHYANRGVKVVFGGIHASANPDLMLRHCDSVVVGEAEEIWESLLDDFARNRLKPLYRNDKVTDLSRVPLLDRNVVDRKKYLYHNVMVTSRGCPFKCDFCYNSGKHVTNTFRNRPLDNVVKEMESLGTKQILFIDDNFIGNIEWTKRFVETLKGENYSWHAAVSANILHREDLIRDFAQSGCKSLFIGFESIEENSISSVGKRQNRVGEYEKLISLLHRYGIMVNASMVFGFDSDKPSIFGETLDWLVANKVETMTAHILTPYPGTVLYNRLISENRIINFDTTRYNTSNVVFRPALMSVVELYDGYLRIYKDFYSFKNIFKRIPDDKNLRKPYLVFNLAYRKFGRLTSIFGNFGMMSAIGRMARKISYGIE